MVQTTSSRHQVAIAKQIFRDYFTERAHSFHALEDVREQFLELGDEQAYQSGFAPAVFRPALALLCSAGLLIRRGANGFALTPEGCDAIDSDVLLDRALMPQSESPPVQHVNIGSISGNAQIGNGNVMNVAERFREAVVAIERDTRMTAEQKDKAKGVLVKTWERLSAIIKFLAATGAEEATKEAVKRLLGG